MVTDDVNLLVAQTAVSSVRSCGCVPIHPSFLPCCGLIINISSAFFVIQTGTEEIYLHCFTINIFGYLDDGLFPSTFLRVHHPYFIFSTTHRISTPAHPSKSSLTTTFAFPSTSTSSPSRPLADLDHPYQFSRTNGAVHISTASSE